MYTGYKVRLRNPNDYFVFGSNTQGRHGKGAALIAYKQYGAERGISRGVTGRCYAICTKDLTKQSHPSISSDDIISQIGELYQFALNNPLSNFYVAYSAVKFNINNSGYYTHELASSINPLYPPI